MVGGKAGPVCSVRLGLSVLPTRAPLCLHLGGFDLFVVLMGSVIVARAVVSLLGVDQPGHAWQEVPRFPDRNLYYSVSKRESAGILLCPAL